MHQSIMTIPDISSSQMDMGFHLSINGCGLKTDDNLVTVASIPRDRLMLETGSIPIDSTHSDYSDFHVQTPHGAP